MLFVDILGRDRNLDIILSRLDEILKSKQTQIPEQEESCSTHTDKIFDPPSPCGLWLSYSVETSLLSPPHNITTALYTAHGSQRRYNTAASEILH